MFLTATSRIDGIAVLQHHLVTGEAIVGRNVLEERHRAPRRSATRPHPVAASRSPEAAAIDGAAEKPGGGRPTFSDRRAWAGATPVEVVVRVGTDGRQSIHLPARRIEQAGSRGAHAGWKTGGGDPHF